MVFMGIDNSECPYIFFEKNLKTLKKALAAYCWKISGLYGHGLRGLQLLAKGNPERKRFLQSFLQGDPVCLRKNHISLQIPLKIEGLSCSDCRLDDSIDGFQVEARIDPESFQVEYKDVLWDFDSKKQIKVRDQVDILFDLEVRLVQPLDAFDVESLTKPEFIDGDRMKFYRAARTVVENLDDVYVNDKYHFIIQKKTAMENSSRIFVKDLKRYNVNTGNFMAWLSGILSVDGMKDLEIFSQLAYTWNEKNTLEMFGFQNKLALLKINFGRFLDSVSFGYSVKTLEKNLVKCLEILQGREKGSACFDNLATVDFPSTWSSLVSCSFNCSNMARCISEGMGEDELYAEYEEVCGVLKKLISGLRALADWVIRLSLRTDSDKKFYFYDVLGKLIEENVQCYPMEFVDSPMPLIKQYARSVMTGSVYGE